jgi:hypothetical protein
VDQRDEIGVAPHELRDAAGGRHGVDHEHATPARSSVVAEAGGDLDALTGRRPGLVQRLVRSFASRTDDD